ncbi:ribonuclease H-like domain-containing protein, partial [Tanacetum coccineum]
SNLPEEFQEGNPVEQRLTICDSRMVLQNGIPVRQVSVQWVGGSPKEAMWEWLSEFQVVYPAFYLEDKVIFEEEENVMSEAQGGGGRTKRVSVAPSWHKDFVMKEVLERAHMPYICKPVSGTMVDTESKAWFGDGVLTVCLYLQKPRDPHSTALKVTLSRSSAEAEYRVYYDNVSAVYMSANPVQHQRTKHIEIDIHFVRDFVALGQVRVLHVPSRFERTNADTQQQRDLKRGRRRAADRYRFSREVRTEVDEEQ